MKWFSLLTVGVMSLCALGSAQDNSFKRNGSSSKVPHTISVQYTPTDNIPLQIGDIIRLDAVISIWKAGFSVTPDGTLIQIKKKGNYSYTFGLLLSSQATNPQPCVVNVEFSKNKNKKNWTVLAQFPVTPNMIYTSPSPTFSIPSGGYLRLRINSISSPVYLPATLTDVTMTVSQNLSAIPAPK